MAEAVCLHPSSQELRFLAPSLGQGLWLEGWMLLQAEAAWLERRLPGVSPQGRKEGSNGEKRSVVVGRQSWWYLLGWCGNTRRSLLPPSEASARFPRSLAG